MKAFWSAAACRRSAGLRLIENGGKPPHSKTGVGAWRILVPIFGLVCSVFCSSAALAVDGTWIGGVNQNYSTAGNWSNNTIAVGTDATATIAQSGATIIVDTNVTLGNITGAWNTSSSLNFRGSAGKTLTLATSGGTPTFSTATYFTRYDYVTNLTVAGSSGVRFRTGSNVLVLQGLTWTSFSGGFTLDGPGNGDGGILYCQAANVLPNTDVTLTPGTGANGYRSQKLVLNAGADQTIGALNSTLVGTGNAYISSYAANVLLVSAPSGVNSNGYSTLTIGAGDSSGTFRGKIGTGFNSSTQAENTNTVHFIHIVKTGVGTQTLTGTNNYSGTTTITGGVWMVKGTHTAVQAAGLDCGRYVVGSNATLAGAGTITPATTNAGSGAMISISGMLSPGDNGAGVLTFNSANSAKPLVAFESGGTMLMDLPGDQLVITNSKPGDVTFNGNAVNFNDLAGGFLAGGPYVLIRTTSSNTFAGVGVDGGGVITNGLSIGTGLTNYPGATLKIVGTDLVLDVPASLKPPSPTGLTNTTSGEEVTLGWVASSNATSYVIYRSTSPNGLYTAIGTTNATTFVDSTAQNGTTYYYKVTGVNDSGEGAASTWTMATPFDSATATVISVNLRPFNSFGMAVWDMAGVDRVAYWNNLVGPALTGDTVTLTSPTDQRGWPVPNVAVSFTGGTGSTSYDQGATIKAGTESTNEATMFATVYDQFNGTASTLTVSNLPFSSYDVVIYFYDDGSARGGSVTLGGTTYYIRGGAGNPAINGTGYVQSDDTTLGTGADVLQGNFVRYNGLTNANFTASLVAQNLGDSTQRLKIAGFQILSHDPVSPPAVPPAAPTGVTAAGGNQYVALSWNAAPTATVYNVKRSLTSGSGYANIASINAPLSSFCDTGVVNGTTYDYVISAANSAGESANSAEVSATPALPAFTPAVDSVCQYSVPVVPIFSNNAPDPYRRAYLWVPPGCTKLQGVMVGLHNMLEKPFFDDPAIRQACADANLGIVFIAGGSASYPYTPNGVGNYNVGPVNMALNLDPNGYTTPDPPFTNQSEQCGAELTNVLARLAAESGYAELQHAPILITGHSAASTFVWVRSVAQSPALTNRVFAILPYKGTYPGSIPGGMPYFHIACEWQEISDWGKTWENEAQNGRRLRGQGLDRLFGEFTQPGTGHYSHPESQSGPIALFIKKAAQYRIPSNWPTNAAPTLNTIDPTTGWLIDVTKIGSGVATAVSYSAWTGAGKDPRRAFWYFDQELAQATADAMNAGFSKKPQMLSGFQTATQLAPLDSQPNLVGFVYLNQPTYLADGATFQVRPVAVNQSPRATLFNGSPLGMATGPILLKANGSGAVRQMGPDTFRIWMSRGGIPYRLGQPWEPFIIAYHPGDANYRETDRPCYVTTATPVFLIDGTAQTITFPAIPNQLATSLTNLTLNATCSSGFTAQYWVVSGPYHCDPTNNNVIMPDPIPAQTKFPARTVVGAWQWGSKNAPQYQSAPAAYRTFWIHRNAFEAWQYDHFGSTYTGSDGATYWNALPASAAGNADPDGDGQSNTNEFLAGTDPNDSASAFRVISIVPQGADIRVTWQTVGGKTNVVQAVDGEYTNNYTDVTGPLAIAGAGNVVTNFTDFGAATNAAGRVYRIQLLP
jgi:autotransporter-associated beta strand protein